MAKIQIKIVGLTHGDIAGRREEFVSQAVGRSIQILPAPFQADVTTLRAYVGADRVGVVAKVNLVLAWRALNGSQRKCLRGRVVKALPFELVMECEVEQLGEAPTMVDELDTWKYSGKVMTPPPFFYKLEYLKGLLEDILEGDAGDEDPDVIMTEYCRLAPFDISREGLEFRSVLLQRLESQAGGEDDWQRRAAAQLSEMSQRMGGDHKMSELAAWLDNELPLTQEALYLMAEPMCMEIAVEEARALPYNLFELYQKDRVQFLRVLYGSGCSQKDLWRVFSCLLWIDAHTAGQSDSGFSLTEIASYCKSLGSWDEAKPIVEMLKSLFLQKSRFEDARILGSIEHEFRARNADGNSFNISHADINVNTPGNIVGKTIQLGDKNGAEKG